MTPERPPDGRSTPGTLSDWVARVDEALRRGETPPDYDGTAPGDGVSIDPGRMRALMERLDRAPDEGGPSTDWSTPRAARAPAPPLPASIGRFRPDRELGRGGFGVVYRAFDPEMGRCVALKVPRVDPALAPEVRRRFLREARAAARLDHPNLVPVFEAGEAGGLCYIASAYCEGPTLRRWVDAGHAPMEPRAAARMALALARAIESMHGRGILHCDLKPGNILLDLAGEPGADPTPRVTDFGLARLAESPPGESTAAKPWGTPPYMAPEQLAQRPEAVGPPADVYALGAILYELLTGRPPHRAETVWKLVQAVALEPPAPPRARARPVPRDLDAIAMRCLEKRPERRYASARELADDLERFLDRRPTRARPLGPARRAARWAARHPTAAVAAVAAALAAGLVAAHALELSRINRELARASDSARAALRSERRHLYVATLALAQRDIRIGHLGPAQARMRGLVPGPGEDDPRDFAWFYLDRRLRRDRTILDDLGPGYECWVAAAGDMLVGHNGQAAGAWSLGRPGPAGGPELGPDRPAFAFRPHDPFPGGTAQGQAVGLSPDGRVAAYVSGDARGAVELALLDAPSGRPLAAFRWPEAGPLRWPRFSADGSAIALGSGLGDPRVASDALGRWGVAIPSGESFGVLAVPGSPGRVAFAAGGARLAVVHPPVALGGGRLEVWDRASGRRVASHPGDFTAMACSPRVDGPIALATAAGTIQLREPARGALVAEWPAGEDTIRALAFSPDGRRLVVGGDRSAGLRDVETGRRLATLGDLGGRVVSAAFLAGSGDVALGTSAGQVVVWHARPLEEPVVLEGHADEAWGVAFSPDGRHLASAGGDRRVILWDARSGRRLATLDGHDAWPSTLAFHPDGRHLASADFGGTVRVWDVGSGRLVRAFAAHPDRIRALAFSPDGRTMATGGRDEAIRLWDAVGWRPLDALPSPHDGQVRALAFSPDGSTLASAGDATIATWDVASARPRARWEAPSHVTCLAFSPDGALLASGDNRRAVTIRDATDGSPRAILAGLHREELSAVGFSPDGRVLAAAGQDGAVTLVDVETGRHHLSLVGHAGGVNAVAFSPDGRTLASASHDGTVRLWWAGPGPPLDGRRPAAPGPAAPGPSSRMVGPGRGPFRSRRPG